MKAAWYEKQGAAHDVLTVGEMDAAQPLTSAVFRPKIPYWPLVFSNASVFFIGSDDVPLAAKMEAARTIDQALEAGW